MSELTYQPENTTELEYFEWDWTWFDNAPDKVSDRILIIGDSITVGYRQIASKVANGRYYVDGIATSKGVDNPAFIQLIDYVMPQLGNCKVIVINNGLHGWHLSADDYEKHYTALVEHIVKNYPEIKLVLSTTTPARNRENLAEYAENYPKVLERNCRARKIAERFNMTLCDMFSVVNERPDLYSKDGVHLTEEAYTLLAETCDSIVSKFISM